MLEHPFYKVAALNSSHFIKKRLHQRCFPMNVAKFLSTPILKNSRKRLLLYTLSLNYRSKKWKIHQSNDLVYGIFKNSPPDVLKKILVLNIFSNSKKNYLIKCATIKILLSTCEWLLLAILTIRYCFSIITDPQN